MTLQQLEILAQEVLQAAEKIRQAKNKDYSVAWDVLGGFRQPALETNGELSEFDVWWVYARKHWGAITKFINKGYVDSEPIEGRVVDMINYLVFLYAMIKDSRSPEHNNVDNL